jgi:hypothetical protein
MASFNTILSPGSTRFWRSPKDDVKDEEDVDDEIDDRHDEELYGTLAGSLDR